MFSKRCCVNYVKHVLKALLVKHVLKALLNTPIFISKKKTSSNGSQQNLARCCSEIKACSKDDVTLEHGAAALPARYVYSAARRVE
jgi:hypothetical protein